MQPRNNADKRSFTVVQFMMSILTGINMNALVMPMRFDMKCHQDGNLQCIQGWNPIIPVSIFAFGAIIGTLATKQICRKIGIWNGVLISCISFCIGSLLVALGAHLSLVSLGRLLTGLAAGGTFVSIPLRRPTRITWLEILMMPSLLFGNMLILCIQSFYGEQSQRSSLLIPFYSSVIVLLCMLVVTFVNRFLIRVGAVQTVDIPVTEESANTNSRGSAEEEDHLGSNIETPAEQFEVNDEAESEEEDEEIQFVQVGIKTLFTDLKYRNTLVSVISLFVAQQITGVVYFIQYSGRRIHYTNDSESPLWLIMIMIQLPQGVVLDALYPKILLLLSICISMVGSAAISYADANTSLLSALVGYGFLHFSLVLGISVPFINVIDFAPKEAYDAAHSLGMLANWTSMFVILAISPLLHSLTPRIQYGFVGLAFFSAIVIALLPFPNVRRIKLNKNGNKTLRMRT